MKLTSAEIKTGLAIEPQNSQAATVTGVVIDRKGYDSAVFTCVTGQASGSPSAQSAAFAVHSSATSGGVYAAISGATATVTADSTGSEISVDLRGEYRYIKLVSVVSFTGGSTPAVEVAGTYALGEAKNKPAV
jgi:hypothetical protein